MSDRDRGNLKDILYAIEHIEDYMQGQDNPKELLEDSKTYDAILMNFIIIGEAANRLSVEIKNDIDKVDWKAVVGLRNIIAHDYFGVDIYVVWATVKIHLPELKGVIEARLR